jgi:predicted NUDIX family NTP pyrophosphohydrolase
MARESAGLLPFRVRGGELEVFLVHPGGPLWAKRDEGAWTIAKGELHLGEDPLSAARREFAEETGFELDGEWIALGARKQSTGKIVHAWAVRADLDPAGIASNTFSMEWPPRSGERREFPEVDRAGWFTLDVARRKILKGQIAFLEDLEVLAKL